MYGQSNASIFFSSNAGAGGQAAMAQRKGMLTTQVVMTVVIVVIVGLLMGGRIFLTNQITGLRTRVADLESRKEFLEANSAELHRQWNLASSGEVIISRAQKELALIVPREPGLVLVCMQAPNEKQGMWRKLWSGLAVSESAEEVVAGAMVSLVPRGARAGTLENGGR